MADQSLDPVDQLSQLEAQDMATAHEIVGEHAVTQEQDAAQTKIDAGRPPIKSIAPNTDTSFSDVLADVGHRAADIVTGAAAGPVHAFGELEATTADLLGAGGFADQIRYGLSHGEYDYASNATGTQDQTGPGAAAQGITQFLTAFLPATAGLKLLGLGTAVSAVAGGAGTQALAFNPHDPRLSNLVQAHPSLANPVTAYLASQPGDSTADGLLKNALEGTLAGAASEAVIGGFSAVLRGMRASGGVADAMKATEAATPTPVELPPEAATAERAPGAIPDVPVGEPQSTSVPHQDIPAETEVTPTADAGPFNADTFVKGETARLGMAVPADRQAALLQALRDGKYADVPAMLDDTHRTIPWDTLSEGSNLKELFNATEGTFGDLIKEAHGTGAVSSDAISQLAADIGGDVQSVTKLYGDTTAQGGLAARITAGYNIMVASGRQLRTLADAVPLDVGSPAGKQAVLDFQKQLELHAAIVGQVRQSSSEIGRALYAHRALKASSDVALSNIGELAGTVLGPKAILKFARDVAGSDDLAKLNAAADKARGNGLMGIIKEVAQNGMLSGLPTQIANLTGNTVNALVKQAERYLAGGIGQVRGVFMPTAETATLRQAVAHSIGAVAGVRDSFPLLIRALGAEQAVSASGRPLLKAIARGTEGRAGLDLTLSNVINRVGQAVRYPGRLMGAVDNLNMGIGRQADLNAAAYLKAANEADVKGLSGDARDAYFDSRMAELRADPTLQAHANEAGLYQSFQEPARTRFGEGVSNLLNSHPLVKLIVAPFVHRPLNMLRQSISDYTLLGTLSKTQLATLAAGNADTDLAVARMTLGTGAIATAYELAGNGRLTGARLGNRNSQLLDNVPAHAIKIGNRWLQYSRVDPVGLWLSIGAELHEAVDRWHDPSDPDATADLATMARMAVQVVGQSAMEKSFVQSADQLLKALGERDPTRADVLAERFMASNAGKLVPFSGALRSATYALDPTERSTAGDGLAGIWNQVKAGLPTLSRDLAPKRDILGRPVERPGGTSAWFNPFGGSIASTDPMNTELSKLAFNIVPPTRSINGFTLTPAEMDSVTTKATQSKLFGGMNLEDKLRQVTSSDTWKHNATAPDGGLFRNGGMAQDMIDSAYSYGKASYLKDHPTLTATKVAQQHQSFLNSIAPAPKQAAAQ